MSKLKIIVLYDRVLVDETEEQAATPEKSPVVRTLDKKEVEEEVAEVLVKLGHEPTMHELDGTQKSLLALQQTAVAAYQALELRDYGRVDMRLQPDGRVHVIEVNPNPWLSSKAEFAMAARKSGRTYVQLIEEIVELANARA